jgi:hypothetical protein
MVRAAPKLPENDVAEDLWLGCHDLWLQPIEWWTAWWNVWAMPFGLYHVHARRSATHPWLTVPDPIRNAPDQDLFA